MKRKCEIAVKNIEIEILKNQKLKEIKMSLYKIKLPVILPVLLFLKIFIANLLETQNLRNIIVDCTH